MIDILKVCSVSPVLPLIGILLSALALLVTLRLLLRLMALETRHVVTQEIADMERGVAYLLDEGHLADESAAVAYRRTAYRRQTRRNGYRLMLLVPSVMLLLGCSTLLYMVNIDNCTVNDDSGDDDGGA